MIDLIGKGIITATITEVIKKFSQRITPTNKSLISEAVVAIQKAIIETRKFISINGYKSNEALMNLWWDAFKKINNANIGDNLPDYIYQKARFWGSPDEWIDNPQTQILIPKLSMLDEQCNMLKDKLNKA